MNAGPKGERGEQGVQGKQGDPLSPAVRRALLWMFALAVAIGAANLYWTSHEVRENNQDKCATVVQLAGIPGPAQHVYQERARQLGCPGRIP